MSIKAITDKFIANEYPRKEIDRAVRASAYPPRQRKDDSIFLKLPYVDSRSEVEMRKIVT